MDTLEEFKNWWLTHRPMNTPKDNVVNKNGNLQGVVLYRHNQYQVQLFIVAPNSFIEPHIHPNVDSFEVYMGGEIDFVCDDKWYTQSELGNSIRVKPNSYHGGKFGPSGGCFLSVQQWLNDVPPTSVGNDWVDNNNHDIGVCVDKEEEAE